MRAATLPAPLVPARTGVWAGMAAIAMMFAALTSALLVREGEPDWVHVRLPLILYLNTLLLLLSSVALQRARLSMTLGLGALFVIGQVLAWRQMAAQGLFLATNPAAAFFYLLTALHGTHLLGGLGALIYVRRSGRQGALGAASLYWHFLTGLWVCLLLILTLRL